MASISNDPNGRRRILFVGADGKRKSIRLGKVSQRYAESVKVRVEDLVAASITGHVPADETSRWLAGLSDKMTEKLARVGLTKPRESSTVGEFTRSYIDSRSDIKPRTHDNLERCRAYLLECFSETRPLRAFTAGDADEFRLHMVRTGRADNTTRRAIGRARQFFTAAKRHGLIQENPFEGIAASVRTKTELAEEFPMHVVCKWIGNSQPVAAQHYLQVTDEHFERAVAEAAQNAAQKAHETAGNQAKSFAVNESEIEGSSGDFGDVPALAGYFTDETVPRRAFGDHDVALFGVSFVIGQGVPWCSKPLCIKGLGHVIPRGV